MPSRVGDTSTTLVEVKRQTKAGLKRFVDGEAVLACGQLSPRCI